MPDPIPMFKPHLMSNMSAIGNAWNASLFFRASLLNKKTIEKMLSTLGVEFPILAYDDGRVTKRKVRFYLSEGDKNEVSSAIPDVSKLRDGTTLKFRIDLGYWSADQYVLQQNEEENIRDEHNDAMVIITFSNQFSKILIMFGKGSRQYTQAHTMLFRIIELISSVLPITCGYFDAWTIEYPCPMEAMSELLSVFSQPGILLFDWMIWGNELLTPELREKINSSPASLIKTFGSCVLLVTTLADFMNADVLKARAEIRKHFGYVILEVLADKESGFEFPAYEVGFTRQLFNYATQKKLRDAISLHAIHTSVKRIRKSNRNTRIIISFSASENELKLFSEEISKLQTSLKKYEPIDYYLDTEGILR